MSIAQAFIYLILSLFTLKNGFRTLPKVDGESRKKPTNGKKNKEGRTRFSQASKNM